MSNTNKSDNMENPVEGLLRHLDKNGGLYNSSMQFSVMKTNLQRVDFVYWLLDGNQLFPALVQDYKDDIEANNCRQKGNQMYKIRKNKEAFEFYTKSIAHAKENSESLALAFANRSAVLFDEGLYEACLVDITYALDLNYPDHLKNKLISRQEKCKQLKVNKSQQQYHLAIPKIPESMQNDHIQCASKSIKIQYSDDMGRHVVATRDLQIGEILAVEKPFSHILLEKIYCHCYECLKLCYNLIPCNNCTEALFCSAECRQSANTYHKYECKLLKTFRKSNTDKLILLSLKICLVVKDILHNLPQDEVINEPEYYKSDRYEEIYKLCGNTKNRTPTDLFQRAGTAAFIYHLIKHNSDFFQTKEDEDVFKELMLKHLQISACNFHEISESAENENKIYDLEEIGAGAYSFLSMFNHSCCPNVVRHCYGPTIVVRAIQTIKKGQQCFDNYGAHYALMTKIERQKLKKQYFFNCNCKVCKEDWPLYINLPQRPTYVGGISNWDLTKLEQGDTEYAKKVVRDISKKMLALEKLQPDKNFAETQEVLKQCFALMANVRRFM